MKNQSILSIVNSLELSASDMYPLVEVYGLERAVELQSKYCLFLAITEQSYDLAQGRDIPNFIDTVYTLHKKHFVGIAIESFKKEYK